MTKLFSAQPRRATLATLTLSVLALTACSSQSAPETSTSASLTASPSVQASSEPLQSQVAETPSPEQETPQDAPTPAAENSQEVSPAPPEESPQETSPSPAEPSPSQLTPPTNDNFTFDPATLATTDLVTGSPVADTAFYTFEVADQPSVVFQVPSGSIACLMQPYGVFCLTDDSKNWVLQSVSMAPGESQPRTVQARGRAASHDWFKTNTVLPQGQSLSWQGITCTATAPDTVHCHDGSQGFTLTDPQDR